MDIRTLLCYNTTPASHESNSYTNPLNDSHNLRRDSQLRDRPPSNPSYTRSTVFGGFDRRFCNTARQPRQFPLRCVFFKVFVNAAENNTRMRAIMPITKPITEKMQAAAKARDQQGVMVHRSELQMIHKRAGFFPAMGTFFLLREMCKIPVPGLETGGILWFKDLTLQDPYFILPMAAATMLHLVLRKGGEAGNSTMDPSIQKAMMFGLPALSLAFTWWFPAAVQLSFAITSTISYGQVVAMANPTFRSFFNMTPVPPQTPTGPGSSSSSVSQSTTSTPSVLSQAELNSRFQGTSTPKKLFNEAKEGFEGTLKLAKEKMSESTEDRERKRVEDYEARRQKEIAQEKIRRTNQARSKRQSKFSKYTQK
ncbi:putative Mitochondrial inner membrane protein OXA1L [Glarea lozoyensis 74030]|uniref:Putative Mitochondrial inner membrane protein OXA1L n=1 Tax=Glarea lozoyensis (strain ATCC 74030 / MF5533) TaxID=1104152 RepID=H0EHA2_GLAL7|nr:putative Mitochondrial inner membrane protein OXA1L [Glarea lozoyensis 74030]